MNHLKIIKWSMNNIWLYNILFPLIFVSFSRLENSETKLRNETKLSRNSIFTYSDFSSYDLDFLWDEKSDKKSPLVKAL